MSPPLRPSTALVRQLTSRAGLRSRRAGRLPAHVSPASSSSSGVRARFQSSSPAPAAGSASSASPSQSPSASSYSSVDAEEISHFNALAAEWWDPQGSSRILHAMNPLRHDFIRACRASQPDQHGTEAEASIGTTPPGSLRYLDVGCGGGIFAESAARLPSTASVTGLDASPAVLAVARAHARRDPALASKLTYVNGPVESLSWGVADSASDANADVAPEQHRQRPPQKLYDIVSVFEVVEHVTSPAQFLDRCMALVAPGGWLVGSTIARTWASWFTTNLMAEDVLGLVPKGTHDWAKYVNDHELRGCFRGKPGWGAPRLMGVVYVPGLGWREVAGSEKVGNYFFGIRRDG